MVLPRKRYRKDIRGGLEFQEFSTVEFELNFPPFIREKQRRKKKQFFCSQFPKEIILSSDKSTHFSRLPALLEK